MFKKIIVALLSVVFFIPVNSAAANSHGKSLGNLNGNDIMFAQMMIPHHQQAMDMSKYALKNSSNKEVKTLATVISTAQSKEIAKMKYWLSATKSSSMMDHDMGMGGMLSDNQLMAMKKLKGTQFDKAFLSAMIEHHQGALKMVAMLESSKNSEAKKLAKDIDLVQKTEIATMKKLLAKIP